MATIEFFANVNGARFTRGTKAFGACGLATDAGRTYWFSVSDAKCSEITLRQYDAATDTAGSKVRADYKAALRNVIRAAFLAILPASGHADTGADHNAHVAAADAFCAANCPAGYVNRAPGIANLSPLPTPPADPFAGWTTLDTSSDADDLAHLPAEHGGPSYAAADVNREYPLYLAEWDRLGWPSEAAYLAAKAKRIAGEGARRIAVRMGLYASSACNVIVRDLAPTILRGPRRAYC